MRAPSAVFLSKTLYSQCLVVVTTQEDLPRVPARAYGSIHRQTTVDGGKKELKCKEYNRRSLSRSPRDSLIYFEISVLRHIRFAELRKKHISQMNM